MFINSKGQQFTQHYKNYLERQSYTQNQAASQMRKKIQNYSFLLKDKIGRGYSSIVYKGINDLTNQQVAIKVIELKSLRDHTCKIMLQNQIECMKEMKHKHILRYQNSFFTINNCYIVTELCEKGDLSKDIKEKKKFSEEEAGKMFHQIYQAYLHFHNAGYVHRDIKPANIFINSHNQLKIADFGFSKKRTIIERETYNVGTPIYMSPQSLTANIYNEKTDVWALGVTLYELVSGEVPFKGKTQKELKVEIDKCCPVFPSTGLSQQLVDFIKKCLTKDSFCRMSIKDMHKHEWLSKIIAEINPKIRKLQYTEQTIFTQPFRAYEQFRTQQDCYQNKNQINDNFDQINLRISLPNEVLHENKSNRYFKVQDQSQKENRRSTNGKIQNVVSMQRLKIHQKKSINNFEIDRPALQERTNSINNIEHLEELKIRRNPYSLIEISQKPKQKDLPPKLNKPVTSNYNSKNIGNLKQNSANSSKQRNGQSKNMQKVVVLINYFRLVFQIDEKITKYLKEIYCKQVLEIIKQLKDIFSNELVSNFTMHIQMTKTKDNIFGLKQSLWTEFTNSKRWDVYKYVIQRYEVKYKAVLEGYQKAQGSSQNLDILIKPLVTLLKAKQDELLIKQKYILNQILYFILHFLNYYQLIKEQGWDQFTQKTSNSQKMVIDDLVLSINNYIEISAINKDNYKKICPS